MKFRLGGPLVVHVVGHSMQPSLHDGDRLLAWRRKRCRVGDVVVFSGNGTDIGRLVKRVAAIAGDPVPRDMRERVARDTVPGGHLLVRGDNPHSIDSRRIGLVAAEQVEAVVLWRLEPARGRNEDG